MSRIEQFPRVKSATTQGNKLTPTSGGLKTSPSVSILAKRKSSDVKSKCSKVKRSKAKISQTVMQRFFDGVDTSSNHTNVHMTLKQSSGEKVPIHLGSCRTRGARAYMEDRHMIVTDLHYEKDTSNSSCCFAAIYDGHNGAFAAQHASERLHQVLASHSAVSNVASDSKTINQTEKDAVVDAFHQSFETVEDEIIQMTVNRGQQDGATALVSMVLGGHLFVANIGDSRAVLARRKQKALRLSIDHKPDLPDEKERIETAGGQVVFSGCWRVAHDQVPVRLAVSRSFGDHKLKNNLPASCTAPLVSAEPFVDVHKLNPEDQFVILASDGVWDRLSDDEAVAIVRAEMLKWRPAEHSVGTWKPTDQAVKAAADKLIEVALRKKTYDNATAIVMAFDW